MKRTLTCLIAVTALSALQNLYAQGAWPVPAKTPNTPVSAKGHDTVGYSAPITTFVGRYLDSEQTRDFQQTFRTARANTIKIVPESNRIYMLIGSSIFTYKLDTFFSRLSSEAMVSAQTVPVSPSNTCSTCRGQGFPDDVFLKPDSFFYAENGGGWITSFIDGQDRLYDFDYDDRGNIYLASEIFGWGVAVDSGGTNFARLTGPQYSPGATDVIPMKIVSVKTSSGGYYVVTSSDYGGSQVWQANDIRAAQLQTVRGHDFSSIAKAANGSRIAMVTLSGVLELYTADAFVSGGSALQTFHTAGSDSQYQSVDSDGTNLYASSYSSSRGLSISVFTPAASGSGYTENVYAIGTQYVGFKPRIRFGANFLTVFGTESNSQWSAWNVRLFSLANGVPTEVSLSGYIAAYYSTMPVPIPGCVPAGSSQCYYSHPPGYMAIHDARVFRNGTKYYLFLAARGLGDVYEIRGADTIAASVKRIGDTRNPNSGAAAGAGPFYGDNITFTSTSTTTNSININWDFGDSKSGVTNSYSPDIGHQYGGLTAGTLPAQFKATATNTADSTMTDNVNITIQAPTVSVGVKNTSLLIKQPDASSPAPIVASDQFVDASDGAVESHYNDWVFDGAAPVRLMPTSPMVVGDCGAHSLTFRAHYGPYDGSLTSLSTDALYQISPFNYSVRPYVAVVATPSSDTQSVTFSSASRFSAAGAALPGAGATAVQYTWELLSSTQAVLSSSNGNATIATIPAFVVPKTSFVSASGLKVRLTLTVLATAVSSTCAPYVQSAAFSGVLESPSATGITVTGCANVGSTCTLGVVSGTPGSDWTYSWTAVGLSGQPAVAGGTGPTYSPGITAIGSYQISLTVSNAIGSTNLTKTIGPLAAPICNSAPTADNTAINMSGNRGCSVVAACGAGEAITFTVSPYNWTPSSCETYSWDFGDGSATSQLASPVHAYSMNGTYTVTLTLKGGAPTAGVIRQTVIVGSVAQPPTPPNPPPTPPGGSCALPNSALYVGFYGGSSSCSGANTTSCTSNEQVFFNILGGDLTSCASFNWNFGDSSASSLDTRAAPTHAYSAAGTYNATVTVHSATGAQQTINAIVKVDGGGTTPPPNPPPPNPPPSGSCNLTSNSYYVGYYGSSSGCSGVAGTCGVNEDVTFSALPNGGAGCDSASFSWNFGDNSAAMSGQQGKHKFATDGTYNVVLSVTSGSTTVTVPQKVFVGSGSGTTTKIDFSVAAWPGVPNGYQFTAISTPAGAITQWHFDFGDGNSSSNATAHNVYADANDYTVTLTSSQLPGVQVTHKIHDAPPTPPRRRASRH